MVQSVGWFVFLLVGGAFTIEAARRASLRQRVRSRFSEAATLPISHEDATRGWLAQWLFLAGFRGRGASAAFVLTTIALSLVGGTCLVLLLMSRIPDDMSRLASAIPGGVGDLLQPVALIAPWLIFAEWVALPYLYVRRRRQQLVARVGMELPLFLDLLATLSQAGLSFDMAVQRILAYQPFNRPLAREFRMYQAELLAGQQRVRALRGMAERLDVPAFSNFVSAIVQAEQLGAGIAEILRRQADDLRERRREQALAMALATPTKLIVPMVACFLPGIFVVALGPLMLQFIRLLDGVMRQVGG